MIPRAITFFFLHVVVVCGFGCAKAQQQRPEPAVTQEEISDESMPPLMRAAGQGRVDEVRRLLKNGANVDKRAELGVTALMVAAGGDHPDIVKILLDAGADPNALAGMTHPRIIITPLIIAMNPRNKKRLEIMDCLIAAGAKVNPPASFYESPLIDAVTKHDLEMIKALLDRGADVNWANEIGHSALVRALTDGNGPDLSVIKLLLDCGADPNKPRIQAGTDCISTLEYLDGWLRGSKTKLQARLEARRLLIEYGAKKYRTRVHATGCDDGQL
jgi:uncharacterized protein